MTFPKPIFSTHSFLLVTSPPLALVRGLQGITQGGGGGGGGPANHKLPNQTLVDTHYFI
jgi:hypothetical protein